MRRRLSLDEVKAAADRVKRELNRTHHGLCLMVVEVKHEGYITFRSKYYLCPRILEHIIETPDIAMVSYSNGEISGVTITKIQVDSR